MKNVERLRGWFRGYLDGVFEDYDKAASKEDKLLIKMAVADELVSMGLATEALERGYVVYLRKNSRCKWRAVIHADLLQKARELRDRDKQFRPSWQHQIVATVANKPYPLALPSNHKWLCPFLGLEDVVV